jgi:proline iminopeptidase
MSEYTIPDNLPGWIAKHLRLYLESGGAEGHIWDSAPFGGPGPVPTLLLTTTGRRSGRPQIMPLIYGETDGGYVVIASKGGAPTHPAWYMNLTAEPEVDVQIATEQYRAKARTATGQERADLWQHMLAIYPPYEAYQEKTEREIPVVVLEPGV